MFNKKRIVVFVVFILFMYMFTTFASGKVQNHAIATRNVTFIDGYNNQEISKQNIVVGEDAEVPSDPTHKNYVFAGWYLESDKDVKVEDFTNIINDLTVIAKYGADKNNNGILDDEEEYYTVKFVNTINNKVLSTQKVLSGMSAKSPSVPTSSSYTFVGWSESYNNVIADLTINTVWEENSSTTVDKEINSYTVTFVDGDDNKIIASTVVNKGLSASTPSTPNHKKRVFDHWEGNYTNVYNDEKVIAIYKDDLNSNGIADEYEITYAVKYNAGLDSVSGEVPVDTNSYLEGLSYTVLDKNTLELDDAMFMGWSVTNSNKIIESKKELNSIKLVMPKDKLVIGSSNVTYYAVWVADKNNNNIPDYLEDSYSIEFKASANGSLEGTLKYENVLTSLTFKEADITIPTPVANKYYKFDSWSPATPSSDNLVGENITYVANFVPINDTNKNGKADEEETYKLTINYVYKNGDKAKDSKEIKVVYNMPYEVESPSIEYYKADKEVVSGIMGNKDETVTVTYSPINDKNKTDVADELEEHYTITFVAGANGSLDGTKEYKNILTGLTFKEAGIEIPTPKANQYYKFKEWSPSEPKDDTKVSGDVTYTANFTPINDTNKNGKADEEETYKLTINYVYKNGDKAADSKEINVVYNMTYEVESPEITNYTASQKVVTGTMPKGNISILVTYTPNNDVNDNGIADELEKHYTIEFVAGANGSLEGTLKYENVLTNLTFENAEITIPTPVANTYYEFKEWTESTPTKDTVVNDNVTYTANFGPIHDENNNGVADELEAHYTITFVAGANGSLEGTTEYSNILTGLTFEKANITIPTPKANTGYMFIKWTPSEPTKDTKVSASVTYTATFAEDLNGNNIPDEKETKYTVIFKNADGTVLKTQQVLPGLAATAPENPTLSATAEYTYTFKEWDKAFDKIESNLTVTATYTATINSYTIKFVDYNDSVISEETYNYGATIVVPNDPTRTSSDDSIQYTFKGWNKTVATTVTGDKTYKATYTTAYKITFKDYYDKVLSSEFIEEGSSATAPSVNEEIEVGSTIKKFVGWVGTYENVTASATITPLYVDNKAASTYAYVLDSIYYKANKDTTYESYYYYNVLSGNNNSKVALTINISSLSTEQANKINNKQSFTFAYGSNEVNAVLAESTKKQLAAISSGTDSKGSYKIEWYVLKYESSDGWHLDGYKVYDETTLSVQKKNNSGLSLTFNNAVKIDSVTINGVSQSISHSKVTRNNNQSIATENDGANYEISYRFNNYSTYTVAVTYTVSYTGETYTKEYTISDGNITAIGE